MAFNLRSAMLSDLDESVAEDSSLPNGMSDEVGTSEDE